MQVRLSFNLAISRATKHEVGKRRSRLSGEPARLSSRLPELKSGVAGLADLSPSTMPDHFIMAEPCARRQSHLAASQQTEVALAYTHLGSKAIGFPRWRAATATSWFEWRLV